MTEYNAKPKLLEYLTPLWGQAKYYLRLDELEDLDLIFRDNPQTAREIAIGFFSVPLVNLVVGSSIVLGAIGLAKLVQ